MTAKKGFNLREICGERILIAEGKENIDFSKVISMNESAAYLWNKLQDKEFTTADMARLRAEEYEVGDATALHEAQARAKSWKEAGSCED